jgi:hypothetical protein
MEFNRSLIEYFLLHGVDGRLVGRGWVRPRVFNEVAKDGPEILVVEISPGFPFEFVSQISQVFHQGNGGE